MPEDAGFSSLRILVSSSRLLVSSFQSQMLSIFGLMAPGYIELQNKENHYKLLKCL